MSPVRVQRRRTKGWRTPLCSCGCGKPAIYVGRPTGWGNLWPVGVRVWTESETADQNTRYGREFTITAALEFYRQAFLPLDDDDRAELSGHDLMCWCPLDQPCHADVLLQEANRR